MKRNESLYKASCQKVSLEFLNGLNVYNVEWVLIVVMSIILIFLLKFEVIICLNFKFRIWVHFEICTIFYFKLVIWHVIYPILHFHLQLFNPSCLYFSHHVQECKKYQLYLCICLCHLRFESYWFQIEIEEWLTWDVAKWVSSCGLSILVSLVMVVIRFLSSWIYVEIELRCDEALILIITLLIIIESVIKILDENWGGRWNLWYFGEFGIKLVVFILLDKIE
jgi:hypothetical protein